MVGLDIYPKVKDRNGKNRHVAKYVEASPYLSGDEEIIIEEGYLDYVLEKFDLQLREVDNAIRASFSFNVIILPKRLQS